MKQEKVEQLTAELNTLHGEIIEGIRQSIIKAKAAGDILRRLKPIVGKHGDWQSWLAEHFQASYETARCYMQVSRRWGKLEPVIVDNPDLSLRRALAAIRVPTKKTERPSVDIDREMLKETVAQYVDSLSDEDVHWLAEETPTGLNRLDDAMQQLMKQRGLDSDLVLFG